MKQGDTVECIDDQDWRLPDEGEGFSPREGGRYTVGEVTNEFGELTISLMESPDPGNYFYRATRFRKVTPVKRVTWKQETDRTLTRKVIENPEGDVKSSIVYKRAMELWGAHNWELEKTELHPEGFQVRDNDCASVLISTVQKDRALRLLA